MKARSILIEGYKSILEDARGHCAVVDLPKENGGSDVGPTALVFDVINGLYNYDICYDCKKDEARI